ncbi:hypothetical protein FAS41_27860 [Pseudomonas nicosulfuronedens]|uniref:Uncharacterized protein n=1 Tax=Pseudomonas nicosulfuronedens TaxID=2571105 RepID=A0A5R9QLW2_9PSED|nr:hypothetical protein [Pseudomonas nicosulfuronedens]TLX70484.1 hypothetical protein FAS41_27860 [Pseudomonas nicosulfuronedens]
MARRPNIQKEATALLAETMRAARKKLKFHETEDLPLDAATISANVSLLKLVEAYATATRGEKEADLEKLRQELDARRPGNSASPAPSTQITPDRAALLAEYGLTDPET